MTRISLTTAVAGSLLVMVVLSVVSVGVASGTPTAEFSSTYDGYDEQNTQPTGHEIAVSGTIDFSDGPANRATIVIRPSEKTVIEPNSVRAFVEGGSVEFEKHYFADRVELRTDRIPQGTVLEIRFLVYPKVTTEEVFTTASVAVESDRLSESYPIETEFRNRPEEKIGELEEEIAQLESQDRSETERGLVWNVLSYIGILSTVLVGGAVAVTLYRNIRPPPRRRRR